MEVSLIQPPVSPFLQVKLDQEVVDYLWNIIDNAKTININNKSKLIGNISQSLLLEDLDSFFYETVCIPLIEYYREINPFGDDPVVKNTLLGPKTKLALNSFWVNYQYQTEFNPYHDHTGVYSFAIWMKIPYDWKEQKKLPQFLDINDDNIKVGNFEFEYVDSLGSVKNLAYNLSSSLEGVMLFFPARLRHCVYPFYQTKEPRISISGNLSYAPN